MTNDALEHENNAFALTGRRNHIGHNTTGRCPGLGADLALSGRKSTTNQFDVLGCVQALPFQSIIRTSTYSMLWTGYKPCHLGHHSIVKLFNVQERTAG